MWIAALKQKTAVRESFAGDKRFVDCLNKLEGTVCLVKSVDLQLPVMDQDYMGVVRYHNGINLDKIKRNIG